MKYEFALRIASVESFSIPMQYAVIEYYSAA